MENETREYSNTTIRTQLTKSIILLASLLTAIRGHLLSFALRFASAESCAQIVTDYTPSRVRDTTPETRSSEPLDSSPPVTELNYDNPFTFVHDIITGRLACEHVSMEQWILAVTVAMLERKQTNLDIEVPYKGGLYKFHHCIERCTPPMNPVSEIIRTEQ